MTKTLLITSSPRGAASKSSALAHGFTDALSTRTGATIDHLDLWQADMPDFDGDFAGAKMSFFGDGEMDSAKQAAWQQVSAITERFLAADHYVIAAPMWNGGIPYRLKQYIDIITQPGLLFGFEPERGYFGLLEGKRATLIVTSGVWAPGADPKYGLDFHSNYLEWWLKFSGVTQIDTLRFQPSLLTADPQGGYDAALKQALALAG